MSAQNTHTLAGFNSRFRAEEARAPDPPPARSAIQPAWRAPLAGGGAPAGGQPLRASGARQPPGKTTIIAAGPRVMSSTAHWVRPWLCETPPWFVLLLGFSTWVLEGLDLVWSSGLAHGLRLAPRNVKKSLDWIGKIILFIACVIGEKVADPRRDFPETNHHFPRPDGEIPDFHRIDHAIERPEHFSHVHRSESL